MRSRNDPYFSDLCDRVGMNEITTEDEDYLNSRIQPCEAEHNNESFKDGRLSIIVTTNKKKDYINSQKLCQLLPNQKEYVCYSVDRTTNLPDRKLSDKTKENPGKTGNLSTQIQLREGAPVIITVNHPKKKYKEDGIINGARGFVQSIQTTKTDPEKVEIVWVVFNKETVGKLYRFEHRHLRKGYDPGHPRATPILPERKTFKEKYGNIEYQRTNFPLALAYAMTSHKCQGETLELVIIDFGTDKENNIKNYICAGSFYVALTRVREGKNVFLRNFERSYIKADKSLKEKIEAMRKIRPYEFKKIYLDDDIYEISGRELKVGYLNINGITDGYHAEYLNADFNLCNLDILVLAETKLDKNCRNSSLTNIFDKWNVKERYDSEDNIKHMGVLVLTRKTSKMIDQIEDIDYEIIKRGNNPQIQCVIIKLVNSLTLGFIYCRSTPTHSEIHMIQTHFSQCSIIMGDLNLSHRMRQDKDKVDKLCQHKRTSMLNEITRKQSVNQLDYVLVENDLVQSCYTTSYHNFISDHNSIVLRIGLDGNSISSTIKQKITFDREAHLKKKISACETDSKSSKTSNSSGDDEDGSSTKSNSSSECEDAYLSHQVNSESESERQTQSFEHEMFFRKFVNVDSTTCWLNSCLQLILTALDNHDFCEDFNSELGLELLRLKSDDGKHFLNANGVRNILVTAEDTRIATRMSELNNEVADQDQLNRRMRNIEDLRLNLSSGQQQCVRDFFLCLKENLINWPDVYSSLSFDITHTTTCLSCNFVNRSQNSHTFVELDVPEENSQLNIPLEYFFNASTLVESSCEFCKTKVQTEVKNEITRIEDARFITVLLRRGIETEEGFQLNIKKIISTEDMFIRYKNFKNIKLNCSFFRDVQGNQHFYEAIAVIEYHGQISKSGSSAGHYTCDIKHYQSKNWYRTNDSKNPIRIKDADVSCYGYVVLFHRA